MLTMSPLPRPQERVLHGILEVFRGYTCVQMGTHDVTHLRGDKSVGILKGWKEACAFMLRILRMGLRSPRRPLSATQNNRSSPQAPIFSTP